MRRRIRGILMTGKQFSLDSRMDLVQGIMSHGGVRHTSEPTSALPLMKEDSVEGVDSG
jgi:histidine decarboxylase